MKNEDIAILFEVHTRAINAEVKASHDMLSLQIKGVTDRQDIANHRVNKLESDCETYSKHVDNTNKVKKNWKWIAAASFLVIFGSALLSNWLIDKSDMVDVEKSIEKVLCNNGVILKE